MFASKDLFFSKPSGGYQISRSVRTRSSASAYFNRTLTTPTLGTKWTWSGWVKRGTLGSAQTLFGGSSDVNNWGYFGFLSGDTLTFQQADAASVTSTVTTTQVFRDPSSWYHLVVLFDSTQATSANRLVMYVNGVQITAYGTATYLAQNTASRINQAVSHTINRLPYSAANYVDGYITEVNFIDGQALTPSSFGQTNSVTGVWQPIKYTGTYGTNGFYLNFSDNSAATAAAIGKDYSGNANNWTPNNISVTAGTTYDSMIDVPTLYADGGNGRGNYCVLNPIDSAGATISDGNSKYTLAAGTNYTTRSTIGMTSGKWYAEWTWTAGTNSDVGIGTSQASLSQYLGQNAYGWIYYNNGNKYTNATATAYGATYAVNDVIGIAFDADAGTLTFYKNGTSQGTAFTGLTSGPYFFAIGSADTTGFYNFGQRPFAQTPPTGFVALNTQNLPTPTISNGANYMAATLYTGNGTAVTVTNTVNGISFAPDFVWTKARGSTTGNNALGNTITGVGKVLITDSTTAEISDVQTYTAFNSNGFSYGSEVSGNRNGNTMVSWQWKAGGSSSSNTSGSITSTVSAGATQGFSVVTYTTTGSAATVGHGLGVAPSMIIVKNRTGAVDDWYVYHSSLGNTKYILLDTTAASATSSTVWNNTSPTSTVFSLGSGWSVVKNYVAYCFSEVAGYSKFGSYTGNGSADGTFVFTNFQPRWVMVKRTDSTSDWYIWDTSRDTYNVETATLLADTSGAETSATSIDGLSNGFKCRSATVVNASGGTYIYAAFASSPFKLSLAR